MSSTATVTTTPQQSIAATGTTTASTSFNRSRFHIEWPKTKAAEQKWQLEQMAGAFRVFARLGFADGGSGHISLRGMSIPYFTVILQHKLIYIIRSHTTGHILDQSIRRTLRSPHRERHGPRRQRR
jgi:hypothetical protein